MDEEARDVDIKEAAEIMRVHTNTVRRYIYSGKLSAHKVGGMIRINTNDIDEFLRGVPIVPREEHDDED